MMQLISILICLLSILILSFEFFVIYIDYILLINSGYIVFVFFKTFGLVNLVRLLTWHYASYNIALAQLDD